MSNEPQVDSNMMHSFVEVAIRGTDINEPHLFKHSLDHGVVNQTRDSLPTPHLAIDFVFRRNAHFDGWPTGTLLTFGGGGQRGSSHDAPCMWPRPAAVALAAKPTARWASCQLEVYYATSPEYKSKDIIPLDRGSIMLGCPFNGPGYVSYPTRLALYHARYVLRSCVFGFWRGVGHCCVTSPCYLNQWPIVKSILPPLSCTSMCC